MYKILSDSYLKTMTKDGIIRQLRFAEDQMRVAEDTLAQQIENTKDWYPVTHAEWEWRHGNVYRCTNCWCACPVEEYLESPLYKYCPNCGAKMDKG